MKKEYQPMLATLVDQPFDSKDWVYETKWDGSRLVAEVRRDSVRLFSRNGIEVTARYPSIAQPPTARPLISQLPGPSTHRSSQLFVSSGGHHCRQYCPRMADERLFEHANLYLRARN
jgi:hypothetical protein